MVEKIMSISSILIVPAYTYIPENQRNKYELLQAHLQRHNLHSIGRYGLWDYFSMEDAYLSGIRVAKEVIALAKSN